MKKLFIALASIFILASCTENQRVREFGGEMTVNLPKGQKLIMATWKETNLFYLVEPMEDSYVPKTKLFIEDSAWGVWESKITFIESK